MKTIAYSVTTSIDQDFLKIKNFLEKTANLLRWTKFFKTITSENNNVCQFETPLGTTMTEVSCEENSDKFDFTIASLFLNSKVKEYAFITLEKTAVAQVEFKINLPEYLPQDKITLQLSILEQELSKLKRLLEENQ